MSPIKTSVRLLSGLACACFVACASIADNKPDACKTSDACQLEVNDDVLSLAQLRAQKLLGDESFPFANLAFRNNGTDYQSNLCQQGKHLPEFFLLGCQKCGSTSFADDLIEAGPKSVETLSAPDYHRKCFYLFREVHERGGDFSKESFLRVLPSCGQFSGALGGFSSDFFHMTESSDLYMEEGSSAHEFGDLKVMVNWGGEAPKLLSQWYGHSDIKKPLFVSVLREPLERFQSMFYFVSQRSWGHSWLSTTGISPDHGFNHFTQMTLAQAQKTGKYNIALWPSLYGKHLSAWLQYVQPSQMMIIPMKVYTSGNGWGKICARLSSHLDISLSCGSKAQHQTRTQSEHPPLDKDIAPDTLTKFYDFLHHHDQEKLVDALWRIHEGGGTLFSFDGDHHGEGGEYSWLRQNW